MSAPVMIDTTIVPESAVSDATTENTFRSLLIQAKKASVASACKLPGMRRLLGSCTEPPPMTQKEKKSGKKLTLQVTGEQAEGYTVQMPEAEVAKELGLQRGPAVKWVHHGTPPNDHFDMTFPITKAEFDTVKQTLKNRASDNAEITETINNLNFNRDFNEVLPRELVEGEHVLERTNGRVPWTLSISLSGN